MKCNIHLNKFCLDSNYLVLAKTGMRKDEYSSRGGERVSMATNQGRTKSQVQTPSLTCNFCIIVL